MGCCFLKNILSRVRCALDDFKMISPGDKIAVGVSGGKDSLTLLYALAKLQRFYPIPFELTAVTIDLGFDGSDYSGVQRLCDSLNIEYVLKKTDIGEVIFNIRKESNPCSLCAKMRRGVIHETITERGIQKIALGHHFDDVVETFFLSLFYEGRIYCFQPVTYLDRTNVTQIRPLLYVSEREIANFAVANELPIVKNPCPANGYTKRQEIKEMIAEKEKEIPGFKKNIFGAIKRSGIQGWEILKK